MRRVAIFFIGLLIAAATLASFPAQARGPCYHLKIYNRTQVVLDKWVGVGCWPNAQPVSIERQVAGETIIETSRYANR
jgi:hypothetical protein